jgi:hypothetical protein
MFVFAGIAGLSVTPLLNGGETGTLFLYDPSVLTDEDGLYRFRQLHIVSGQSELYNVTFQCVGATSAVTPLLVYDTLDPDISSLGDMELVVGLSLLAAIPLMLFNSAWVTASVLVQSACSAYTTFCTHLFIRPLLSLSIH